MEQEQLLPAPAIRRNNITLSSGDFPQQFEYWPEPSDMLLTSIQEMGILHAPLVTLVVPAASKQYWRVLDGKRRIKAAIQLGIEWVNCVELIFPEHDAGSQVTLQMHGSRSSNKVGEASAIRALAAKGKNVSEIAKQTGIAVSTIKSRMVLYNLQSNLFEALLDGQISESTALACAKLPREIQQQAYQILAQQGKLGLKDIKGLRQTRREESAVQLDMAGIADQVRKNVSPSAYLSNQDLREILVITKYLSGKGEVPEDIFDAAACLEQKVRGLGVDLGVETSNIKQENEPHGN